MPEIPDLELYRERLAARVVGAPLEGIRLVSPFVLRTVEPPPDAFVGRRVTAVGRLAKQIVLSFEGDLHAVLHLMLTGRLQWRRAGAKPPGRLCLAAFNFPGGTLLFTESSKKKRAALRLVAGEDGLAALDPGGVEPQGIPLEAFRTALQRENHTLKRALTDQRIIAGIGNAYSDEVLHRARLSPFRQTAQLGDDEWVALHAAVQAVLAEWRERLADECGAGWPGKVTAFHPAMAVHGRYREPCPDCGAPVQRIQYAETEANYCARCQTGGRVLADRSLSRLLKANWPKRIEELEGG